MKKQNEQNFVWLFVSHKNLIMVTPIVTMNFISFMKPQNFIVLYDNEKYIVNLNRQTIKKQFQYI